MFTEDGGENLFGGGELATEFNEPVAEGGWIVCRALCVFSGRGSLPPPLGSRTCRRRVQPEGGAWLCEQCVQGKPRSGQRCSPRSLEKHLSAGDGFWVGLSVGWFQQFSKEKEARRLKL